MRRFKPRPAPHADPTSPAEAQALADLDPDAFQRWVVPFLGGEHPTAGQFKKGADKGVDGVVRFRDDRGDSRRVIFSVKAGRFLHSAMVRDLRGTIEREDAPIGVLVTMRAPTRAILQEAATAGHFHDPRYQRIQVITVDEAFKGRRPQFPGVVEQLVPPAPPWGQARGEERTKPAAPDEMERRKRLVAELLAKGAPPRLVREQLRGAHGLTAEQVNNALQAVYRDAEGDYASYKSYAKALQSDRLRVRIADSVEKGKIDVAVRAEALLARVDGTIDPTVVKVDADVTVRQSLVAMVAGMTLEDRDRMVAEQLELEARAERALNPRTASSGGGDGKG